MKRVTARVPSPPAPSQIEKILQHARRLLASFEEMYEARYEWGYGRDTAEEPYGFVGGKGRGESLIGYSDPTGQVAGDKEAERAALRSGYRQLEEGVAALRSGIGYLRSLESVRADDEKHLSMGFPPPHEGCERWSNEDGRCLCGAELST